MSSCRLSLFVGLVASLGVAACSSNSSPNARAYVDSQLSAGALGAAACGITDPVWVSIGTSHQPADDGSSDSDGSITVNCTVTSNSDGTFNVTASAVAQRGGSITITSTAGHGFSKDGQQTNVRAVFQRGDLGRFEQDDCTVTYDDQDGVQVGVAAGRVGGTLDCPLAQNAEQQATGPDGGAVPKTCHAHALFRFENCNQ